MHLITFKFHQFDKLLKFHLIIHILESSAIKTLFDVFNIISIKNNIPKVFAETVIKLNHLVKYKGT